LVPAAFEEIKEEENRKIKGIEEKYQQDMKAMREEIREEMKEQLAQMVAQLKPEVIREGLS